MTTSGGSTNALARRHFSFGWWSLAAFATAGLILESLHGFKVGAYLDVGNDTRRLMWTLAHAHGTLLALVHVAFALTLRSVPELQLASPSTVSNALVGASILLPGGFFLGGVQFYGGDPGLGVLLVPVGAVCLIAAAISLARACASRGSETDEAARASRSKSK